VRVRVMAKVWVSFQVSVKVMFRVRVKFMGCV